MSVIRAIIIAFFLSTSTSFVEPYRILTAFPYNGKSHSVMFNALLRGLANRGHHIDDITHFPLKNPPANYRVVVNLNGTIKSVVNSFTIDYTKELSNDMVIAIAKTFGNNICELLKLDDMQKFIKNLPNGPPYDLVITEAFGSNCYMGFGPLLKVPVVAVSTCQEYPWINHFIGHNDNLAVIRHALLGDFDGTKFFDRLRNIVTFYRSIYKFNVATADAQTTAMRKYLSPDLPHVRDVEKSVALTLVNSHIVLTGARPLAPSLIEVGGLHVDQENATLSPKMKKWLDESPDGFVYFTLGSLVIIESLPVHTLQDIYRCIRKIAPVKVLMKIVDPRNLPPGLPDNVLTSSWIPQQAVLSHPNIRVFITHGGLMGTQEALYFGVPLIGIPLFGDQYRNIESYVEKNIAIKIELNNLGYESLSRALDEALTNPKYSQNTKLYSKLFKDRPASAMDTSIFWIEYIIRNGPDPLRSPALDLTWWQLMYFDIFAFILLVFITILLVIFYSVKLLIKLCRKPRDKLKKT